jgi:hypothetical protein
VKVNQLTKEPQTPYKPVTVKVKDPLLFVPVIGNCTPAQVEVNI